MVVHKAQTGRVSGKWGQSSCSWGGNGWLLIIPPIRGKVIHTETIKCKGKVFVIVVDWVRATMWRFWSFNLRASALSRYGTLNSKYAISSLFKNVCVCACVCVACVCTCMCVPACGELEIGTRNLSKSLPPLSFESVSLTEPRDHLLARPTGSACQSLPHQFWGYRDAWHAWTLQGCWGVRT